MTEPLKMKKRIEPLTFEGIANGRAMKEADQILLKIQEDIRDLTKKARFNRELNIKIKVVVNEVRISRKSNSMLCRSWRHMYRKIVGAISTMNFKTFLQSAFTFFGKRMDVPKMTGVVWERECPYPEEFFNWAYQHLKSSDSGKLFFANPPKLSRSCGSNG